MVTTTYVEVAAWPLVRYIYLPDYGIWRSSWYWGYYPSYWNPWRPYYWHYYYGYHYNWYPAYYSHFHRYDRPRYDRWNDFYYSDKRVYSRNVTININEGRYKTTYSRPEMEKGGEALYAKVHPERASSMSTGTTARRCFSDSSPGNRRDRAILLKGGRQALNQNGTRAGRSGSGENTRSAVKRSTNHQYQDKYKVDCRSEHRLQQEII